MLVEEIEKAWAARAKSAPFYPTPTFVGDALTLGAGTEIARVARKRVLEETISDEARALALFAAAFRRPLASKAVAHFRLALQKRAEGDRLAAAIHVAMMGLPRLDRRDDARRLFAADRLLKAGVAAQTIFAALDLDSSKLAEAIRKYSPDQPRVPAGNGRISGQWAAEAKTGGARSANSRPETAASRRSHSEFLDQKEDYSTSFSVRRWDPPQS